MLLTIVIPTNAMDLKYLSHSITIHIQLYQMLKCTQHLWKPWPQNQPSEINMIQN